MPVVQFTPVAGQPNEEKALEIQGQLEDQETEDSNAEDIEIGSRVYANRCAGCYGAELEGTDQAGALSALDMTQNDFLIFLRTGGDLGNSHQFGPAKASNAGIEDLWSPPSEPSDAQVQISRTSRRGDRQIGPCLKRSVVRDRGDVPERGAINVRPRVSQPRVVRPTVPIHSAR
ncbi:MAG: hypothetical protein F4Y80_15845 [Caldilineaceae bacterium SB0665_bin_21]|nr:hypothetical protein [Caldilineaceae bacterium SB0665_bin_21]